MADQLINVVAFSAVAAGGSVALPHEIKAGGVSYIPDLVLRDNGDFDIVSVTSTTVTVTNNGAAPADCNVFVMLVHSTARALGPSTSIGNFTGGLTPRPFVAAAGSAGGGGGTAQAFTYTATGVETDVFTVTLPVAMPSDDYIVIATMGQAAAFLAVAVPDGVGDRTVNDFVCWTSLAPTAGDTIDFYVTERT